jgi:hypothetical protein
MFEQIVFCHNEVEILERDLGSLGSKLISARKSSKEDPLPRWQSPKKLGFCFQMFRALRFFIHNRKFVVL